MSGAASLSVDEVLGAGPQTTPQHALEQLRRAIIDGELRPGQRIAQEQVALRLGMSIAPVREALQVLEDRLARRAAANVDERTLKRVTEAAEDCVRAAETGRVGAALEANRRFHFAILEPSDSPHTMRVIQRLCDATEAYRALYYNSPAERQESIAAHERIIEAVRAGDADRLVAELDAHQERALTVLRGVLSTPADSPAPESGTNQV